jgi:hypothetical protein
MTTTFIQELADPLYFALNHSFQEKNASESREIVYYCFLKFNGGWKIGRNLKSLNILRNVMDHHSYSQSYKE